MRDVVACCVHGGVLHEEIAERVSQRVVLVQELVCSEVSMGVVVGKVSLEIDVGAGTHLVSVMGGFFRLEPTTRLVEKKAEVKHVGYVEMIITDGIGRCSTCG